MPFDNPKAKVLIKEVDELAALGITPIPASLIEAHKYRVASKYSHRPHARWEEVEIPPAMLARALADPQRAIMRATVHPAAAPRAVIAIADTVRKAIPDARFALGYFYADPYLAVSYGDTVAYLGLWLGRRRLKAIATRRDDSEFMIRLRTRLTG